jgi:hypothetical protein
MRRLRWMSRLRSRLWLQRVRLRRLGRLRLRRLLRIMGRLPLLLS